ncbi:Hypothetical protein IALB_2130 [Ignavibacterium album JCM 16511]|uniref:Uncharacterized protein n=1 Tax=Ignavibacterium album (strain DSM 19864 / JCM 16511 / NBRC 101810 / Mat9-16) TaxID=945713 RepID=I0ALH8_IGNAJ|nr:Hypothetical protein IALB_2130 [Ignavibacterium album JCM 16511]
MSNFLSALFITQYEVKTDFFYLKMDSKLIFATNLNIKVNSIKNQKHLFHFFNLKLNSLPIPTVLFTSTFELCASIICLTIDNPSPVPPTARERALSTL